MDIQAVETRLSALLDYLAAHGFVDPGLRRSLLTSLSVLLLEYLILLKRWTARVDLVSPAPLETLLERHVVDSLAAWIVIKSAVQPKIDSFIDIGSGAGLPGLVWAALSPQSRACLVEPRDKRVQFLKEAVSRLALKNVDIVCDRSENLASAMQGRTFALVTSRAVGAFGQTVSATQALLEADGVAAFLAGPSHQQEAGQFGDYAEMESVRYRLSEQGPDRALSIWKRVK